jgi:hypothetical protein
VQENIWIHTRRKEGGKTAKRGDIIPILHPVLLDWSREVSGDWAAYVETGFHSSKALHPFIGPWPLLQFRNLYKKD